MSKYGPVNLRIQSECRKIWTRKNSVSGHFSRSDENWLQGGCLWKRVQRCCPYYWLKIKFTLSTLSYLCFVKAEFLKNPRKALRWHLFISAKLRQLFFFFLFPTFFYLQTWKENWNQLVVAIHYLLPEIVKPFGNNVTGKLSLVCNAKHANLFTHILI